MTNKTSFGINQTRSLSPKAEELLSDQANGRPVWVRSPKRGVEFYTGLSRAKLYELAGGGKITSRSIREPGQVKGTRLFLLQSILDFIEACCDGRTQTQGVAETAVAP